MGEPLRQAGEKLERRRLWCTCVVPGTHDLQNLFSLLQDNRLAPVLGVGCVGPNDTINERAHHLFTAPLTTSYKGCNSAGSALPPEALRLR